ncbi:MAG: glycosyltransferase family 2 protein [Patescibacteria group bacterium]
MRNINIQEKQEITVGIPTYYGGVSLIDTVTHLCKSKGIKKFKIIVTVDGKKLDKSIRDRLTELNVQVLENKSRLGQFGRIKQLVNKCNTAYFAIVQDDVRVDENMLSEILSTFKKNKRVTMVAPLIKSALPLNFFQKILNTGVNINYNIAENWNNADNYLLSSGRSLAFKTTFIKKFNFPRNVVNSDAYLYFENKRKNGKFVFVNSAIAYNKLVSNLKDHLKQSYRFQGSKLELTPYFSNINQEYIYPKKVALSIFLYELLNNPLYTLLYLIIFIQTRVIKSNIGKLINTGFWNTAEDTKK